MPDSSRSLYVTLLSLVGFIIPLHLGPYTDLISILFTTFPRLLTRIQSTVNTTILVAPCGLCKAAVKKSICCSERAVDEFPSPWNRLKDPWSSIMKMTLSQDPCKVDCSPSSASNKLRPWQRHFPVCLVRSKEGGEVSQRWKEDSNSSDTDEDSFLPSCYYVPVGTLCTFLTLTLNLWD